jgi:hypothetical protein
MIKHIILWKLKEMDREEQTLRKAGIKTSLEALAGKIPGLVSVRVNTEGLPSSTADVMLDTSFTDYDSLKAYKDHPLHVAAADTYVRPYTDVRLCLDFEEE